MGISNEEVGSYQMSAYADGKLAIKNQLVMLHLIGLCYGIKWLKKNKGNDCSPPLFASLSTCRPKRGSLTQDHPSVSSFTSSQLQLRFLGRSVFYRCRHGHDISQNRSNQASDHETHYCRTGYPDHNAHDHGCPHEKRGLNRTTHNLLEQDQGPEAPEVESRHYPENQKNQTTCSCADFHPCFNCLVSHGKPPFSRSY